MRRHYSTPRLSQIRGLLQGSGAYVCVSSGVTPWSRNLHLATPVFEQCLRRHSTAAWHPTHPLFSPTTNGGPQPCARAQDKLDELHGKYSDKPKVWSGFFFETTSEDHLPPKFKKEPWKSILLDGTMRCRECGCTISEHKKTLQATLLEEQPGLFDEMVAATANVVKGAKSGLLVAKLESTTWPCESTENACLIRPGGKNIVDDFLETKNTRNMLVLGQPGIGKSFLGGYAVHRLLTEVQSPTQGGSQNKSTSPVVYGIRELLYLYDPRSETTTVFDFNQMTYQALLRKLPDAFVVHDCGHRLPAPPLNKKSRVLVLSSPDGTTNSWSDWKKQTNPQVRVLDVWSDNEIKDACSFLKLNYEDVQARQKLYGPIPRHIFSELGAETRRQTVQEAIGQLRRNPDPLALLAEAPSDKVHPTHKLMMMRRVPGTATTNDSHYYVPAGHNTLKRILEVEAMSRRRTHRAWLELVLKCSRTWAGNAFQELYFPFLLERGTLNLLLEFATELTGTKRKAAIPVLPESVVYDEVPMYRDCQPMALRESVLYKPQSSTFSLGDYFIVQEGWCIIVQLTVADDHRPTTAALSQFYNYWNKAFGSDSWKKIKQPCIIYLQADGAEMKVAQDMKPNITHTTKLPHYAEHLGTANPEARNAWATNLWSDFVQLRANVESPSPVQVVGGRAETDQQMTQEEERKNEQDHQ